MVKIERTPIPPASLAIEKNKANGSYREKDVVNQLKNDFHGKCYICELNDLTDIEVEHLLPHYNRSIKERVFDWNNLFYSCPHCNSLKNNRKYDEKILDCCKVDPELLLEHTVSEGNVCVTPTKADADIETVLTAELIESSFQKDDTGLRSIQSSERYRRLTKTMGHLYKALEKYNENKESVINMRVLRCMLNRKYKFSAFTRQYVRSQLNEYPELRAFLT